MRFLKLSLRAIGPFTDAELDLSGGESGLHIVYGPNEAGKSSTLRALKYLLFGFPIARTKERRAFSDDFLHPQASLRVGATLRSDAGETLSFVRRLSPSQSLRAENDVDVMDEAPLRRMLGDMDASAFETFFGIDHQRLVDGGRAILAGQGDVGQVLFSASGMGDLRLIQKQLDDECASLFLAQGRKPTLNALLLELRDKEKQVKEASLSSKSWDEHHQALQNALARKSELERLLEEKTRERSHRQRLLSAHRILPDWNHWSAERDRLKDAVLLPAGFAERRQKLQQDRASEEGKRQSRDEQRKSLEKQIEAIELPDALLAQGDNIETLREEMGVYRQAQNDRPKLEEKRKGEERQAQKELQAIERSLTLAEAEALRLTEHQRTRVRTLSARCQALLQQRSAAADAAERAESELSAARAEAEAIPEAPDVAALQAAFQSVSRMGDLDALVAAAREERDKAYEPLEKDLKRLPFWSGTLEAARSLPIPAAESVERMEGEWNAANEAAERSAERVAELQREIETLERTLESMRQEHDIPTEEDLTNARAQRDEAWDVLVAAARSTAAARTTKLTAAIETFETRLHAVDVLADRLRKEADKVAEYAQKRTQAERLRNERERRETEARAAEEQRSAFRDRWRQLWEPAGIAPQTPREMAAFLRAHAALVQRAASASELDVRLRGLQQRRDEQRASLARRLSETTSRPDDDDATLPELLSLAERIIDESQSAAERHKEALREVQRKEREQQGPHSAVARRYKAEQEIAEWKAEWLDAVSELPINAAASPPAVADDLDRIAQVKQLLTLAEDTHRRLEEIDASCKAFEEKVRGLTAQLDPELGKLRPEQAAAELHARWNSAVKKNAERAVLTKKRADEEHAAERSTEKRNDLERHLERLISEAGRREENELPEAEALSAARQRAEEKSGDLEVRLREWAGPQELEAFLNEVARSDRDLTEAAVARLTSEIDELNRELKEELGERIGAEKKTLAEMNGQSRAAELAEAARDFAHRIAGESEHYARTRLASAILKAGIERYRERHQGPILSRASTIFERLTCGAFTGLRQDFAADGTPVLVGLRRGSGLPVFVESMSDGTADQIYLSLRLAWLDEYLASHESAPFIVDDVLIRFDDERAVETLRVLGELSRKTQVLFFTHHQHLIERAREALPEGTAFAHTIPRFQLETAPAS